MTIERIEKLTSREGIFRLHFSDGKTMKVPDYVIAELGLYVSLELNEAQMKELSAAKGLASAKNRAVRIISASGIGKRELEYRLVQKGEREEDAREAVRWLADLELLDDRKTAEQIVRSAGYKGYGRARVKQILFEKRIPEEYWEEALAQLPQMDAEIDAFLQKRLKGRIPDEKETKRTVDALVRRGHSWQDIKEALQRYSASLELDLEEEYE